MATTMTLDNELHQRINRYLDDAIALEASLVTALKDMREQANDPQDRELFDHHLTQTEVHHQRLEDRLHALGGTTNRMKGIVNKLGIAATDMLHLGKDPGDKATRNLMQAFASENLEIATYEALATAADTVGDADTARLAREIQAEERETADRLFQRIAPIAARAVQQGPEAPAQEPAAPSGDKELGKSEQSEDGDEGGAGPA